MRRNSSSWLAAMMAIQAGCMMTVLIGCSAFGGHENVDVQPVEFTVHPSARTVAVGEVVTLTTRSANTVGRQTSVNWSTTGGELETEQNKRIARARFEKPGVYTVSAVLHVDSSVTKSDAVDITVR